MEKNQLLKGYILTLSAVSIFAISSGLLIKQISLSPFVLYGIGAFVGLLFLLIALFIKGNLLDAFRYPRQIIFLMIISGLGISINNGLYFTALKAGSIANAALSHNLAPLLVAFLFAPLMLGEKLTKRITVLALMAFFGLFILTIPSFKTFDIALIYGGLSAIFYAFTAIIKKKVMQLKVDPFVAATYQNLIPFCIYAPFAAGGIRTGISLSNLLLVIIWGVFALGVAFVLSYSGLKRIPATNASILTYIEPIGAIILAFIFFQQPIDIYIITGGFLIVLSGILLVKGGK